MVNKNVSKKRSRKDLNEDDNVLESSNSSINSLSKSDAESSPRVKRRRSSTYEEGGEQEELDRLIHTSHIEQIKREIKKEVEELKNQLKVELKQELKQELKTELKKELKEELEEEVKEELRKDLLDETSVKITKMENDVEHLKMANDDTKSINESKDEDESNEESNEDAEENKTIKETKEEPKKFVFGKPAFTTKKIFETEIIKEKEAQTEPESKPETKQNNTENEPEQQEKGKETETAKPIFGSKTTFGSIKPTKNVFESLPSSKSFGTFGTNSKFGNAFQDSLNKKSIFDTPQEPAPTTETSNTQDPIYKQVDLTPKTIHTGEEDEFSLFNTNCKIFELDLSDIKTGWKERGIGQLHLNKNTKTLKSRIIVRSNGLMRVILNMIIGKKFDMVKGMLSSMQSEKFIRITTVDNGNPVQYAVKLGNGKVRDSLYDAIIEIIEDEESGKNGEDDVKKGGVAWLNDQV